jgi:hypothetical protein
MSLQDWAAVGEIVGAIAVVVTLIYLAVQIRNGNRATRVATIQSALESEIHVSSIFATYADTWETVVTGMPLADGEERRRGIVLYNLLMVESEKRYHQFHAGYLDQKSWDARQESLRKIVALPIYTTWQSTPGAMAHSASFLSHLDRIRHSTGLEND